MTTFFYFVSERAGKSLLWLLTIRKLETFLYVLV